MNPIKADDVADLLRYATNQEVSWHLQCPQSEFVFHFKSWNLNANIPSLSLFENSPEVTANDALLELKHKGEFPTFVEPQDFTITISPDLTKLFESLKPAVEAMNEMADKLGESYTELSKSMATLFEKVEKLCQAASSEENQSPAQHVLSNPDINQKTTYPCGCVYKDTYANLRSIIMHLNDMHKWSRESIADWLDTLPSQPIYYPHVEVENA